MIKAISPVRIVQIRSNNLGDLKIWRLFAILHAVELCKLSIIRYGPKVLTILTKFDKISTASYLNFVKSVNFVNKISSNLSFSLLHVFLDISRTPENFRDCDQRKLREDKE